MSDQSQALVQTPTFATRRLERNWLNKAGVSLPLGSQLLCASLNFVPRYFEVPLCDPPAHKCRHGLFACTAGATSCALALLRSFLFSPLACPAGLNKDEPGRPYYQQAYDIAITTTEMYVQSIIDALNGDGAAIRALMGVAPMVRLIRFHSIPFD